MFARVGLYCCICDNCVIVSSLVYLVCFGVIVLFGWGVWVGGLVVCLLGVWLGCCDLVAKAFGLLFSGLGCGGVCFFLLGGWWLLVLFCCIGCQRVGFGCAWAD